MFERVPDIFCFRKVIMHNFPLVRFSFGESPFFRFAGTEVVHSPHFASPVNEDDVSRRERRRGKKEGSEEDFPPKGSIATTAKKIVKSCFRKTNASPHTGKFWDIYEKFVFRGKTREASFPFPIFLLAIFSLFFCVFLHYA